MGCGHSKGSKRDLIPYEFGIVGAPAAGKSTVTKQFCLQEKGFTSEQRREYKDSIAKHAYGVFNMIVESSGVWGIEAGLMTFIRRITKDLKIIDRGSNEFDNTDTINEFDNPEVTEELNYELSLKRLGDFNGSPEYKQIKTILASKIEISKPIEYVLDNLSRMLHPDYDPTDKDILHVRIPTISFEQVHLHFDGHPFNIVDVGGEQKYYRAWCERVVGQRKKISVIFVVSCCDIGAPSSVRDGKNRYQETVEVLEGFLEDEQLKSCLRNVFIFVNKIDRFHTEFKADKFNDVFPDFDGDTSDEAMTFFEKQIKKVCSDDSVIFFKTCAISSRKDVKGNIAGVLEAVRSVVMRDNMKNMGFL